MWPLLAVSPSIPGRSGKDAETIMVVPLPPSLQHGFAGGVGKIVNPTASRKMPAGREETPAYPIDAVGEVF